MKKLLILTLTLTCLLFCSCGGNEPSESSPETNPPETNPPETTALETLNTREKQLYDALIKMISSDFFDPSQVRVLEIGDTSYRTHYAQDDFLYGTDSVVVRLQGENRVGGTLNHYYRVCIVGASAPDSLTEYYKLKGEIDEWVIEHDAEPGEYAQLAAGKKITYSSSDFNLGKINRALAEYWADLGL